MKPTRILFLALIALVLVTGQAMAEGQGNGQCKLNAHFSPGGQTVPETTNGLPTTVTLNIGGTDGGANGDATSIIWEQIGGPTVTRTPVATNGKVIKQTFSAPDVGPEGATLTFRVTVSGDCGQAQSDTTIINITYVAPVINPPTTTNHAPVAAATLTPSPANEGVLVTLDGSTSSDVDGNALSYSWVQLTGTTVTLDNSAAAIATFTAPGDAYPNGETLTFRLTVSDGSLSSSIDVTANIVWVNDPPQASITACPSPVKEGDSVTLTGSGYTSDDPITSYAWSQLTGVPNADLTNVDLSQTSITFAAPTLTALPPLHTMTFGFTATDQTGLSSQQATCSIEVLDVTKPEIKCDAADGQWHKGSVTIHCTASDAGSGLANTADGDFYLMATAPDGVETADASTGTRQICDAAATANCGTAGPLTGNKIDNKAPVVTCSTAPAKWFQTDQTATCTITDGGSGVDTGSISFSTAVPANTETANAVAVPGVSSVCDKVGNCSTVPAVTGFMIDKKAPTITIIGGPANNGSYYFGFVPAAPTCTATDGGSGVNSSGCVVTNYSNTVGSQTLTATAVDNVGNIATQTVTYTVLAWTLKGFYQPVEMGGIFNTVKNGSTVPLKFEIFAGSNELKTTDRIKSLQYGLVNCSGGAETGELADTVATGGTTLRFDTTADQFVYNWKVPGTPNLCYEVKLTTQDGSLMTAYFKLK